MITNNAVGYSYSSKLNLNCFLRNRDNGKTFSSPGKYIYVRDNLSEDFWSTSWQPVCKPLDKYKYECRHGSGYTVIESEYDEIKSETHYFVPKDQLFEIWHLKLENRSNRKRPLSLFSFVEYENYASELETIQLIQKFQKLDVIDGVINHSLIDKSAEWMDNLCHVHHESNTFNAFIGGQLVGFETDLKRFIGDFRTNSNPISVEKGCCSNSKASEQDLCGVLQINTVLEAGETKNFFVFVGVGRADSEGKDIIAKYGNIEAVEREFNYLIENKTCITNAIRIF
jgi:N,N'-diacetylchitobiose phosphorylase